MVYDFITIGAGASGLFANVFLPKNAKKLILEKNKLAGVKVLMSGGERANFTNIDIGPEKDYFSQNSKAAIGFLARFSNWDTINFFESRGLAWKIEDRGRVITQSGHARDILKILLKENKKNQTKILLNQVVVSVKKVNDVFEVKTKKEVFKSKNLIVSVGGRSYPQVGTDGFGYKIAKEFGLNVNKVYKGLVGIVTKENFSKFSGTTLELNLSLYKNGKLIYSETGPLLFTHWGISGPVVYNAVLSDPYLEEKRNEFEIKLNFLEKDGKLLATKRLKKELNLSLENNTISLRIQALRSWKEAKVTAGGIDTNELTKFLESKKLPGLFFIGEVVDITGKTGGFNLQWAWSSAYCMAEKFKRELRN